MSRRWTLRRKRKDMLRMNAPTQAHLNATLSRLDTARDTSGLQETIEELRDLFGVDHMIYHWVSAGGDQYGCGTYAPAWVQRYIEQDYLRVDPVIIGCFQQFHPVDWKRLDWSSKSARAFQAEAIEHGIGNQGYSVPVRGPGAQFALFTVSSNTDDESWATFTEENRRQLILIAHAFNEKALDFEPDRSPLSISENTLRTYIESARHKLGAMNTIHAVARALNQGLIVLT